MIATILIALLALVTAGAGVLYIPARRKATKAYAELLPAEGDAIAPAREKYWSADKKQKKLGLTAIVGYAVVMFGVLILRAVHLLPESSTAVTITSVAVTVALVAVGITAQLCNDKDSEARIERDAERRYGPSRRRSS